MKYKQMLAMLLACAMVVTSAPANLTTIWAQDANVGIAAAAVSGDASYMLPDLDCTGWWTDHTEGIRVTEEGCKVTLTNKTYENAGGNWNTPLYVLYHGDEPIVGGVGYSELFVNRSDIYGWSPDGTTNDAVGGSFIKDYDTSLTTANWDEFLSDNKAGTQVTIYARRVGDNVVVEMDNSGCVSIATIAAGDEDVYLSLSGEMCTLSDIQVGGITYPQAQFSDLGFGEDFVFVGESFTFKKKGRLAFYDLSYESSPSLIVDDAGRVTALSRDDDAWVNVYTSDDEYLGTLYFGVYDNKQLDLSSGFRSSHTEGVEITEKGVKLRYKTRSRKSAANNWETPSYVLFQGNDNQVYGDGYQELFVNRSDLYGWSPDATTSDYTDDGTIREYETQMASDWADFLSQNKAGTTVELEAVRAGDEVVIKNSNAGAVSTATLKIDPDMPAYLSLTGENCVIYDYDDSEELAPMTGVAAQLSDSKIYLSRTAQIQLSNFEPRISNHQAIYEVEDPDIASVDGNGLVRGEKPGSTEIVIRNADGDWLDSVSLTVGKLPVSSQGAYDTDLPDNGKVTYVVTPYEDDAVVGLFVHDSETDDKAEDYYDDSKANGFATTSNGIKYFYNLASGSDDDITVKAAELEDGEELALKAGNTYEVTAARSGRNYTVTYTDMASNQVLYTYTVKNTALLPANKVKTHFEKVSGDCSVYVKDQAPASLTAVRAAEQNIVVGEKTMLTVDADSAAVDPQQLTFTSSDPAVLSVSADGEVTGLKAGTATVSVADKAGKLAKVDSAAITVVAATETTVLSESDNEKKTEKTVAYGTKDQTIAVLYDGYKGKASDLTYEWTLNGEPISENGILTRDEESNPVTDEEGNLVYDANIKVAARSNRLEIKSLTAPVEGLACSIKANGQDLASASYTYQVSTGLSAAIPEGSSQNVDAKDGKAALAVTASVAKDTVSALDIKWYAADKYVENASVSKIENWELISGKPVQVDSTSSSCKDQIEVTVSKNNVYKAVVSDGVGNEITKYFGVNVGAWTVDVSQDKYELDYEKDKVAALRDKAVLKAVVDNGRITVKDEGKSAYVAKSGNYSYQWKSSRTGAADSYTAIEGAAKDTYTVTAEAKKAIGPYYQVVVTDNDSTANPKAAVTANATVTINDNIQVQREREAYYAAKNGKTTLKVYAQTEEDFAVEKYQWYKWTTTPATDTTPEKSDWAAVDAAAVKNADDMSYSTCEVSNIAGGERYYCQMTDSVGNVRESGEIVVLVSTGIAYQSSPQDVTVKDGEKAALAVNAVATNMGADKVTYQWQLGTWDSTAGEFVYTDIAGAKGNAYTTDALKEGYYPYQCVLSDGVTTVNVPFYVRSGAQKTTSLIAVDKSKLDGLDDDSSYGSDRNTLNVIMGQACDLEVAVKNQAANSSVTYAWYKNGAVFEKDGKPCTTAKITTDKMAKRDDGSNDAYYCVVSDGTTTRHVYYDFTFATKLSCDAADYDDYLSYEEGQELKVNAHPIYGTTVSYQWYQVTENGDAALKDANTDTYEVVNFEKADTEKTYKCVVTDGTTEEEVTFDVSFYGKGQEENDTIGLKLTYDEYDYLTEYGYFGTGRYVAKGSEQTLAVKAEADPSDAVLTYQWYKNNTWNEDNKITGATEAAYVTTPVEKDVTYICRVTAASDKFKEPVTADARFELKAAAEKDKDTYLNVRSQEKTTVALGETLSVSADAINGTVYTTWYQEDMNGCRIKVGTDAAYTPAAAGVYYAVVGTNEKGASDDAVRTIRFEVLDFAKAVEAAKDTEISGYVSSDGFRPLYKFAASADDHVTGGVSVLDETGSTVYGGLEEGKTYYIRPYGSGSYDFKICAHKNAVSTTITAANCVDGAITKKVCKDCNTTTYTMGEPDPKAHTLEAVTVNGETLYYTCKLCGQIFKDEAGTAAEETVIAATHKHTMVKTEAKAATCTEAGNTEYYTCSGCGKLFADEAGTDEITKADTILTALGHSVKTIAHPATCTEDGIETYYQCTVCGKFFVDPECKTETTEADAQKKTIPAIGHDYLMPVFTWAEDGRTATYTYVCANDSTEIVTGDADVTSKVVKEASCTKTGLLEYTASVEVDGKTYEATRTVITEAAGHDYETVVTKATPSSDGSIVEKCKKNDSVRNTTVINKIGDVMLAASAYTYDGKAKMPAVTVKDSKGKMIAAGNYTVAYSANTNAGTAKVTVTFKGSSYSGTVQKTFKINPAKQSITKVAASKKLKLSKLKKKKQNFKLGGTAKGALSYKKTSGSSKIKVSSKGVVTVAKGTKKGTYKIKVTVTAKAAGNYEAAKITKTVKIVVK